MCKVLACFTSFSKYFKIATAFYITSFFTRIDVKLVMW